jgi:hypothetical protein
MPFSLIDDILSNASRARLSITDERAEQIAVAVRPRLTAFATIRSRLSFDDAPSFESELLAARQLPEAAE